MVPVILKKFHVSDETADGNMVKYGQIIGMNLLLMPICLMRDLSSLAHFNLLGIIAILYIVTVIIV